MRLVLAFTAVAMLGLPPTWAQASDELVPGERTAVKPGKLVRFVSRSRRQLGDAPFVLPVPGSAQDPILHGATLTFSDVGLVAGSAEYVLHASGWRGLGSPSGSEGYRYNGRNDTDDPDPQGTCRTVLVRERVIRAECRIDVPLSPPFADAETIVLEMGAGPASLRYCAEFGGDETRNDSSLMRRRAAPPPLRCPVRDCPPIEFLPVAEVAGACWYPAPDTSCTVICGAAGLQYSEATRTFAGSDGTATNCAAVLSGFGGGVVVADGDCESVGLPGLGCVSFPDVAAVARCVMPPTTADALAFGAIRACACR